MGKHKTGVTLAMEFLQSCTQPLKYTWIYEFHPLQAELVWRNIRMYYLCIFLPFLNAETLQVVQCSIRWQDKNIPISHIISISSLPLTWQNSEPGHQQQWYSPGSLKIMQELHMETKWPPFCRSHVQMDFVETKLFWFLFHWNLFSRVQLMIS